MMFPVLHRSSVAKPDSYPRVETPETLKSFRNVIYMHIRNSSRTKTPPTSTSHAFSFLLMAPAVTPEGSLTSFCCTASSCSRAGLSPLPRIPLSAPHRVWSSRSDRCSYVRSRDPHNIRKSSPSCFQWFSLLLSHSQATAYTCADQGRHRADSTLLEIAEPLLCVTFSSLICCSAHVGIFRTSNPAS